MKTILLSNFELPYEKIGSWTTMYDYYLSEFNHKVDVIVCPYTANKYDGIEYSFIKSPRFVKYIRFIKHYKYINYWKALKKELELNESLLIKIIDNTGLLKAIDFFARKENVRNKIKIIFFFHGYSYDMTAEEMSYFYARIDHLVLITKKSYQHQIDNIHAISCEVTQIYNGIDSKLFHQVDTAKKSELRKKLDLDEDTLYFVWLSQDRPKKGLHIILKAWEILIKEHSNIELIIIGTHNTIKADKVRCLGRIENSKLPGYYQAADFYLFSTLCHEGFGLSLVEAMKCGCYCIASDIDPISEVLGGQRYGALVKYPNFVSSWVESISENIIRYMHNAKENPFKKNIPAAVYDIQDWCKNINSLLGSMK